MKENLGTRVNDSFRETVGFIVTNDPSVQIPHCNEDYSKKEAFSWFLHAPLTTEGSWLNIWNESCVLKDVFFIPFGCFLILRSDVIHSGVYGEKGNLRLHRVLLSPPIDEEDTLMFPIPREEWYDHSVNNEVNWQILTGNAINMMRSDKLSAQFNLSMKMFRDTYSIHEAFTSKVPAKTISKYPQMKRRRT